MRAASLRGGGAEGVDVDGVGVAQYLQFLAGHLAEHPDAEAGTGEGMAGDEGVLDTEGAAYAADLVLEEGAQGLDDVKVHFLRKTAYVVVGLDGL